MHTDFYELDSNIGELIQGLATTITSIFKKQCVHYYDFFNIYH